MSQFSKKGAMRYVRVGSGSYELQGSFAPGAMSGMTIGEAQCLQDAYGGGLDMTCGPEGVSSIRVVVAANGPESAWLQARDLGIRVFRCFGALMSFVPATVGAPAK